MKRSLPSPTFQEDTVSSFILCIFCLGYCSLQRHVSLGLTETAGGVPGVGGVGGVGRGLQEASEIRDRLVKGLEPSSSVPGRL